MHTSELVAIFNDEIFVIFAVPVATGTIMASQVKDVVSRYYK